MIKKVTIILIFIMILVGFCSVVYAGEAATGGIPSDLYTKMQGVSNGSNQGVAGDQSIAGGINIVIGAIRYAGSGIALVVTTILGIKYMLASPQDKADVKKQITPILIGCFLLFGAVQIAGAIESLAGKIF